MQKNKSKARSKRKSIFRAIMSLSLAATLCFPCSLTLAQEENEFDEFVEIVLSLSGLREYNSAEEVIRKLKRMSINELDNILLTAAAGAFPGSSCKILMERFKIDLYTDNYYLTYLIGRLF